MSKSFDQGREEIAKLCKYFANSRLEFLKPGIKEAHVRQSLIDPLFEALGWDVANKEMAAPQYREVVPEDSLEIEGSQKAPDYTFRIQTIPKFFTEAKKCGVNINGDPGPAYQLRRYGWSARVPFSILTDFEELGVYDCSIKPKPVDKASFSRTQYYRAEEYPDRWRELWDVFSKEAVIGGAFDKLAASTRRRGTSEVDDEFLKEIEGWRDSLARNIALRNQFLAPNDLNTVVHRTIDRIIFLRMAEDRGSEPYGQLLKLCDQPDIYKRFINKLCRKADDKYNSGLFHFRKEEEIVEAPDFISTKIQIDDKVFKPILLGLYFENGSPYHFGVLPVEILGTVYERFLGKVIRLTAGHQAKVEEKPEVRKAGGVYYTPAYIVNYIVNNTVGKIIEGKSPAQLAKFREGQPLRVLDMACGSGSFLIGAFQCLLDHCLKWYQENSPEKQKKEVYKTVKGEWRLTIAEKKRILTTHIFGVDIDPQAVEVSKLSLLLKVMEGETDETVGQTRMLFHERALPNLTNNIKCGNSLIGPDYFSGRLIPDIEELKRLNPFDWKKEFSGAIRDGGFNCVIGNPPWGGDIDQITQYIETHFPDSTQGYRDTFKLFIDQGLKLTRKAGMLGFIIPSAFMFQPRYIDVRRLLRRNRLFLIWNVGDKVFGPNVVAPACVFVISREAPTTDTQVSVLDTSQLNDNALRSQFSNNPAYRKIPQSAYAVTTEETFVTYFRALGRKECKLEAVLDCKDCGIKHQRVGVGLGEKGKSDLAERLYYEGKQQAASDKKYLLGADLSLSGWYMDYSNERYFRGNYERILRSNEIVYFNQAIFDLPKKIVWRQTSDRIRATIIGPHWFSNTLQSGVLLDSKYDLRYVLALLNSRFLNFIYIETVKESGRVFPQVKMGKVRALPFRKIDFGEKNDKAKYECIVALSESMLDLHRQFSSAKGGADREMLQRQIDATDREINRLVYELYELTEEDIKVVEAD
ncbi:MAG: N-6 DNA methylase [Acidobacteriota bacterium]|jgi:hypothetical protein|nr:N-6 DNA methylase [Acidobacteriota bacterium]